MKNKHRPTLYLIGGLARTGKSKVMRAVMRLRHVAAASTDTTRAAIRKVLTGESYIAIHEARFRGKISFHRPGSLKVHHLTISKDHWNEDEMTWQGILGLIETHDRHRANLLIEGIAITPERVRRLRLKNLRVRAVFLGYEHESHLESILAYSRKKKDWINTVIKEHGGDDTPVRKSVQEGIAKSSKLRKQARKLGYGYFDVSKRPFKAQIKAATTYLTRGGW